MDKPNGVISNDYEWVKQELARLIYAYLGIDDCSEEKDRVLSIINYNFENDAEERLEIKIPFEEIKNEVDKVTQDIEAHFSLEYIKGQKIYECAITLEDVSPPIRRRELEDIGLLEDPLDSIKYSLGLCSFDYVIHILAKYVITESVIDKKYYRPNMRYRANLFRHRDNLISLDSAGQEVDWRTCLIHAVNVHSLRIEADRHLADKELEERALSLEFKFMYCKLLAVNRIKSVTDLFYREKPSRHDLSNRSLTMAPQRKYDKEAIDYYRLALSTNDPYLQYISYYHVLEFYFPQSFNRMIAESIRDSITERNFDLSDQKLCKMANEISRLMGDKDELGLGNEKGQLKAVLSEFVSDTEKLCLEVEKLYPGSSSAYATSNVGFVGETPKVKWDDDDCLNTIAARVYQIRNSLIHTKGNPNGKLYRPFEDKKELQKEVPLVRVLAETVIDAAGICLHPSTKR